MKTIHYFLLLLVIFTTPVFAQIEEEEEDIVEIVSKVVRTVEPSFRMIEAPKIIDTTIPVKTIQYPLLNLKQENVVKVDPILPANIKLAENKLSKLYNGYVRLGIGSPLMPLGELFYNNNRSKKNIYGIELNYLNSLTNLEKTAPSKFDRTYLNAYVGAIQTKHSVRADIFYKNYGLNRYGSTYVKARPDSISQRYRNLGGKIQFNSTKKDSLKLNYALSLQFNNYKDQANAYTTGDWNGNENNLTSINTFSYNFGREQFAIELNYLRNQFSYGDAGKKLIIDSAYAITNNIVTIKPSITTFAFNNRLKAQVGVDLSASSDSTASYFVYPIAEIKYALYDNLFIPYVGVKGGLKRNTFQSLSTENPFMGSNPTLLNESTPYNVYLGMRGILSKNIEFNGSANFAEIRNRALFIRDTNAVHANNNQFSVVYDTIQQLKIEAAISYHLVDKVNIDFIARFFNYQTKNQAYAWNLPIYQFTLRGNYAIKEKFVFGLDFHGEGGRKTRVFEVLESEGEKNKQLYKELGFILDANVSLEYRYTKRLSAFVWLNNVAAQQYFRWYKYPVQAFQVMGGLTFKF
ncbi:MAG: hypothetical protein EB100_00240 [Crocinitomicaceae bacterium]|nr:hypothetical protein [Crocinitomicaceae bacterium]